MTKMPYDVVILGGLGHVGLPLGMVFAETGLSVCLYDTDAKKAEAVMAGSMPFLEEGGEPLLKKVLASKKLSVSLDSTCLAQAKYVIIAIGTPVDEYLNPQTRHFIETILRIKNHLHDQQILIVRSTVYPQTCEQILANLGKGNWKIAYCPERIVQGQALKELRQLPQLVAGMTEQASKEAENLFSRISPKIIQVSMREAELSKLFSNAWRYIHFAVANQFYMIARRFDVDYERVRKAMTEGYERALNVPGAGFAAGPCLLKDTMQLAAFEGNHFLLGHAAMMVNEGLPSFLVEELRKKMNLRKVKVGILGMAFKANIDDPRDSLSYKLGKILRFHGTTVYYSDEYVQDPTFSTKEDLLRLCDVILVGVPHTAYRGLEIPKNITVIDLWGVVKGGKKIP